MVARKNIQHKVHFVHCDCFGLDKPMIGSQISRYIGPLDIDKRSLQKNIPVVIVLLIAFPQRRIKKTSSTQGRLTGFDVSCS